MIGSNNDAHRRVRWWSMLCALLLTGTAAAPSNENMIANGDFSEAGQDKPLTAWTAVENDGYTLDAADHPPGVERSLRIEVKTRGSGDGQVRQRRAIQPNKLYRLTGWLKSTKPYMAYFQIKLFDGKKELRRITCAKSSAEWKPIDQRFSSEGADMIEVLCRYNRRESDRGEQAFFADVKLVEAVPVAPSIADLEAVATFQSIGLTATYLGDAGDQAACTVRYREAGESSWRTAMPLVRRPTEHQFRGSLLNLQPDRDYDIEIQLWDKSFDADKPLATRTVRAQTWTHDVPIARTVRLPAGTTTGALVINDQGTEDGWILYTSAEDGASTVDVGLQTPAAVRIEGARYVIVENLTIRGGNSQCVYLEKSDHIRILRCDIAGWGTAGTPNPDLHNGLYVNDKGKAINHQAGVHVGRNCSQVVVAGNFIHGPQGTANTWEHRHPMGPQGVILNSTAGNNVVANNDIVGDERHWFNDCIESMYNPNVNGGPYRDTDIHGNLLAFSNDDGAELDGGQRNVRFFNNWVQWAYCGVSCAPNIQGPSYVFRNLFVMTGEERGRTNFGFKMGGDKYKHPGVTHLLHNTMISDFAGLSTGHYGGGATPIVGRNNVFLSGEIRLTGKIADNYDLDHDLLTDGIFDHFDAGLESHAKVGAPTFVNAASGDYRLASGSAGVDAAAHIAGVNDQFTGDGPDIGAFEADRSDADFPVRDHGLSALPLMVNMTCVAGGDADPAEVRLRAPANLGSRWTAYSSGDWLTCEPRTGALDGREQVIRLRPARTDLDVRRYRGSITFRTDAGYCRTVLVALNVHHPQPVAIDLEAESSQYSGDFARVEDPSASGGAFLHKTNGASDDGGVASFVFNVPADGVYYVLARTMAPGPHGTSRDSFFSAMDDQPAKRWNLLHAGARQWHWMPVDSSDEHPRRFSLSAGRHVFHVKSREALARLDAIRITNQPYPPRNQN